MACVMNWLCTAAQSASPESEIQEQMTKLPREVYLVPCLECHFAGIVHQCLAVPPKSLGVQGGQCLALGDSIGGSWTRKVR